MPTGINTRDNKTVGVYSTAEIDGQKVSGHYAGNGAPPASWATKITLGFAPKYVVISDLVNNVLVMATIETSLTAPLPPGALPGMANTAGAAISPMATVPANVAGVLFARDGFYVDGPLNLVQQYDYFAMP